MSAEEAVQPDIIAGLGDDIRDHLKHFSPGERVAIALYLLSITLADLPKEDSAAANMLAAQAMAAGAAEHAA